MDRGRRRFACLACLIAILALLLPLAGSAQAGPHTKPSVKVLLTLAHPKGLHRFAREVSTPGSKRYRGYRSVRALIRRYGASKHTRRRAKAWLERHGMRVEVSRTHDWIIARAAPGRVPRALLAGPALARAQRGRSGAGSVPPALAGTVEGVEALDDSPARTGPPAPVDSSTGAPARPRAGFMPTPPSSARPRTGTPAGCAAGRNAGTAPYQGFTPNQYTHAYGLTAMHEAGFTGEGQRMALLEVDKALPSDIRTFADCFGLDVPPTRVHHVLNRPKKTEILGETTLDLSVVTAAAPDLDRIDIYAAPTGAPFARALVNQIAAALTSRKPPDVISASLGACEADQAGSRVFTRAVNNGLAIAAGAGISTFFASQDTGSSTCRTGTGALPIVSPSFPGTSPFTTSVGGTNFELDAANGITDQFTWNDKPQVIGASGGGSSGLFGRPWFQRGVPVDRRATGKGRQVPDIAALADVAPGYAIYCSAPGCPAQGWFGIGGTSAATPLLAGATALINQASAARGQANVGLLNPLLYKIGSGKRPARVFYDITAGNNDLGTVLPGAGYPLGCCFARPGYDRATGWGSPAIPALDRLASRVAP